MGTQFRQLLDRLASIEFWAVAGAVALSMFSAKVLPWTVCIALAFWITRYLANGVPTARSPADLPIVVALLMLPVTLWVSPMPGVTRPAVLYVLAGIALYYAIVNWATSLPRLRLLVIGLISSGLVLALCSPLTVDWSEGSKFLFQAESIYSNLPQLSLNRIHPNVFAGTLVPLFPIALALFILGRRQLHRGVWLLAGFAAISMIAVLILTQSRGGLLGAAAIALILMTLWRRWALSIALAGAGVVAGVSAWIGVPLLEGLDGRLVTWSWAVTMVQDFPWTGVGMGTFETTAKSVYLFQTDSEPMPHAHNLILQVAVDLGIPGLVAWLAVSLAAMLAGWHVYRFGVVARDTWFAALGAGILCCQGGLMAHGLVDAVTWGVEPAVFTWAEWAMAMAAWNIVARQQRETESQEIAAT